MAKAAEPVHAQNLDVSILSPHILIFGEWTGKQWYIFDIYDRMLGRYWKQYDVRRFVINNRLNGVQTLYVGPFADWNTIRSYYGASKNPDASPEIIVKNTSKLMDKHNQYPIYLKIISKT